MIWALEDCLLTNEFWIFFFKKSKVKKKIPKAQFHCNISVLFLASIKIVFFRYGGFLKLVISLCFCDTFAIPLHRGGWTKNGWGEFSVILLVVCDVVMDFLTPKMRIKYLHLSAKVCRAGTDYKTHLPTELHYITLLVDGVVVSRVKKASVI